MKRLVLILTLAACREDEPYEGSFDQPVAAAVVDPSVGGPFKEPIGYVANAHGGEITPLALKTGRFLADDPASAFLRGAPLATGGARSLVSVAAAAPDVGTVSVFAGDARFSRLVRAKHVVDVDDSGFPVEAEASLVGEPTFTGSGSAPTLTIDEVRTGYATSETFTLSSDGAQWWVSGTRSGRQEHTALPGETYTTDRGGVVLTIDGPGALGDKFEFTVDAGVDELDLGGVPAALATRPDQSVLAAIVEPGGTAPARLAWVDPVAFTEVDGPALPAGSDPSRLAWSEDGAALWVADSALSTVWEVRPDDGDVVAHPVPWPVSDVTLLTSDAGTRLYLQPRGTGQVWVLDVGATPADDAFVDANAWVAGTQGLDLHEPLGGIEAIPVGYRFPETDAQGVRRFGRSVGIALSAGRVVFLDEETGCLVKNEDGPLTVASSSFGAVDYDTNFGASSGGPTLAENGDGTRHVVVNPCAGVARTESWTVTFDASRQGYVVKGSLSGEEPSLAFEGTRYVSDDGAVSFLVLPGATPTQDGWQFSFAVDDGAAAADRTNGDQTVAFDVPSDPVFFHYRVGPTDNGWDPVDDRPFLLVAGSASDSVERVDPSSGILEVDWR